MSRYNSRTFDLTLIPLGGALVTGLLAGVACGTVAYLVEYPHPLEVAAAVGAVAALLAWFYFRSQAVDLFRALNDISQPVPPVEKVEEPKIYAATVKIDLLQEDGRAGNFIELPARPDQLAALADGLSHGRQFAQTGWTGKGQPFTRAEFETLRGAMLRAGLARWNNTRSPNQGASLTPAGRAILKHFETPPLPHQAMDSSNRQDLR